MEQIKNNLLDILINIDSVLYKDYTDKAKKDKLEDAKNLVIKTIKLLHNETTNKD